MALQFNVRLNKKPPHRIVIERAVGPEHHKTSKFKSLGAISGFDPEKIKNFIKEKELTLDEQYDLENYLAHLEFNQNSFHTEPNELKRTFCFHSPQYESALRKLWHLAKKFNISFLPAEIQQTALLHKAKAVERKINELSSKPINVLEPIGLDIRGLDNNEIKERKDKFAPKLFSLILKIDKSLDDLCSEFVALAKKNYHKNLNFKPHYLKKYATSLQRVPKWYYAVAIDLLIKYKINPIKNLPASKIATYWIVAKKDKFSLNKALEEFKNIFEPNNEDQKAIIEAFEEEYKKGISTANT